MACLCAWTVIGCVLTILALIILLNKLSIKKIKDINHRHVVVTGGSSGIGLALAKLAAKEGANVTIIARNQKRLDEAKSEIEKYCKHEKYQRIKTVSADISDQKVMQDVSKDIILDMGPVYMLVNCAGLAVCGILEDMSKEDVSKLVNTNLMGTIYTLQAFLPAMKEHRNGIVMIVGSQASLLGIYGMSVYSATKFALRGLAESLHMELHRYNISVTLALPPDTDTPGFIEENRSKPIETDLISQSAGLFKPDEVAEKMFQDAVKSRFFSYIGFESFMLTTLCSGMSPFSTVFELIVPAFLMGPFKIISAYYLNVFKNIIKSCEQEN